MAQVCVNTQGLFIVADSIPMIGLDIIDIPDIGIVIPLPYTIVKTAVYHQCLFMGLQGSCVIPPFAQHIPDICTDCPLAEQVLLLSVNFQGLVVILHGLFIIPLELIEDTKTIIVMPNL